MLKRFYKKAAGKLALFFLKSVTLVTDFFFVLFIKKQTDMTIKSKFANYHFICENHVLNDYQDVIKILNVPHCYFITYATRAIKRNVDNFYIKGKKIQIQSAQ